MNIRSERLGNAGNLKNQKFLKILQKRYWKP